MSDSLTLRQRRSHPNATLPERVGAGGGTKHPKIEDPEIRARLLEAVGGGATYIDACGYAGVSQTTLYRWMNQGEADDRAGIDTFHRQLYLAMEEAQAQLAVKCSKTWVGIIDKAEDYRAIRDFMDRRFPHWAPTQKQEVTTHGDRGGDPALIGAILQVLREFDAMATAGEIDVDDVLARLGFEKVEGEVEPAGKGSAEASRDSIRRPLLGPRPAPDDGAVRRDEEPALFGSNAARGERANQAHVDRLPADECPRTGAE